MSGLPPVPLPMAEPGAPDPDDPLIAAFFAARGRGIERAMLDMRTHFTPREMALFGQRLAESDHPERAARLQQRMVAELVAAGQLQEYRRHPVCPDADFYSDGAPPAGKALLICFGGLNGRLGVPTANFLQAVEARRFDVLYLRDRDKLRFRLGLGEFAPDFMAMVQEIRRRFRPEAYDRVVTYGNSMGGVAALQVGMHLGAERAVAIGARVADDAVRLVLGRWPGPAFDPICDCLSDRPLAGLLVHAADCLPDARGAADLRARHGGRIVVVKGTGEHNLAGYFWALGELPRFLGFVLDAPLPRDRHAPGAPAVLRKRLWARVGRGLLRLLQGRSPVVQEP